MKNFRRSLRYLWPYRRTLAASAFCVLVIGGLWGGGIGMILPVLKVLMDPEGLHGWVWNQMAGERLGARVIQQALSPPKVIDGRPMSRVLQIQDVKKGKAAEQAGLRDHEWILGLAGRTEAQRLLAGEEAGRALALEGSSRITVRVYNLVEGTERTAEVSLKTLHLPMRLAGRLAALVPEPRTLPERFPLFVGLLLVILAMTFVRNVFQFVQEYLVESTCVRSIMDIRCAAYTSALGLPVTFFSEQGTTDTTSRFVKDTNVLTEGQVTLFGKTLAEPGKAVGALVMAFLCSWELTLLALVAGPPTFLLIRRFARRMRKASTRALEGWSAMLAILEETLVGIRVVKAYTMEGAERKRFFRTNRQLLKQQRRMAKIDAASSPLIEALGLAAATAAASLAGYLVLNERMDPYVFATWMGLLVAMFDPLRKIGKVITRFHKSDAAAARIFELIDRPRQTSPPGAPMLPPHRQSIEMRGVRFRYPGASQDALREVNLTVRAGQTLAIVGPNGSGKTTLVSLVPRLIDPTEGRIFVDGHDISECSMRSLRRQIGLVTQETVIFHATIGENVAYGLRRPREQDVLAAARKAFVDEFVRELPEGYDTVVGEHGATLSGGQRQRIAIARAILRDPAILIFDEAMSQVDADSERKIHQAMEEFVKGRTTLLIAHRFATVLSADQIVVMDAGRIVDCGTHVELLERCGLYGHLYRTQFAATSG